ncbi:MAG: M24 family metallopeptidase [Streptosporangiales bacterium]
MPNVLIYADTEHSPELRHEVPVSIPDPFLYAEVGGMRHALLPRMEIPRVESLDVPIETHPPEEFGSDDFYAEGIPGDVVRDRLAERFCERYGIAHAAVPDAFPVRRADALRAAGVKLTPEQDLFNQRRRVKTAAQLAGIERAQRAATAGMAAVADLVRRARPEGETAVVDGEPLTSERLRHTLLLAFLDHGATADEAIAAHGAQAAIGHEAGSGAIRPGESIIVDIWPRDLDSACYTDMSRTFVVGEPPAELVEWQKVARQAQQAAVAAIRPDVAARAINDAACEVIEAAGHPTVRTKEPGTPLDRGFFHGLGHGVGLHVHEAPMLGHTSPDQLVTGDVLAVEPGIYRPGFGGCRLEDIVLVTDNGARVLTDFPHGLG